LRLVQAEPLGERMSQGFRGMGNPRQVADRVTGEDPEQEEVDRDRDEDRHDREEQPLDHVVGASHIDLRVIPGRSPYPAAIQARLGVEMLLKTPGGASTNPVHDFDQASRRTSYVRMMYGLA